MEHDTMPKPGPSEWGKLSAGQTFGLLASDFGRALFSVGWGRYELMLIGYLMENSWGVVRTKRGRDDWPDPVPVRPNFYALSIAWKVPCQRLYEARDSLRAKTVVLESDEGLWLNKNADEWTDPKAGTQLVSAPMLAYAVEARSRKGAATDKHGSFTPEREPINETISRPGVNPFHGAACNDFTPQRETISRPSVKPHIGTGASEDLIQTSEDKAEQSAAALPSGNPNPPARTVAVLKPTPEGKPDPKMMQPYPGGMGPMDVISGPHEMADADARSIYERIWQAWGKMPLCRGFYTHQRLHSAATWREAIRDLMTNGTVPGSIVYVCRRAGSIEVRPPDRGGNGRASPERPAPERPRLTLMGDPKRHPPKGD